MTIDSKAEGRGVAAERAGDCVLPLSESDQAAELIANSDLIVLEHDAKLTQPRMPEKRANRVFSFRSKLEPMAPGLRGSALLFQHIGFLFIQRSH